MDCKWEEEIKKGDDVTPKAQEVIERVTGDGPATDDKPGNYIPGTKQDTTTEAALQALVTALKSQVSDSAVNADKVREIIATELASRVPITVEVKNGEQPIITMESVHMTFPQLLYYVGKGDHVYMHGPPGGGASLQRPVR